VNVFTARVPPSVCRITCTHRSKWWTRESRRFAISWACNSREWRREGIGGVRVEDEGEGVVEREVSMVRMSVVKEVIVSLKSVLASCFFPA